MSNEARMSYPSEKLYGLLAELAEEIEALPKNLQPSVYNVAMKLLDEVTAQAEFERIAPATTAKQ